MSLTLPDNLAQANGLTPANNLQAPSNALDLTASGQTSGDTHEGFNVLEGIFNVSEGSFNVRKN